MSNAGLLFMNVNPLIVVPLLPVIRVIVQFVKVTPFVLETVTFLSINGVLFQDYLLL